VHNMVFLSTQLSGIHKNSSFNGFKVLQIFKIDHCEFNQFESALTYAHRFLRYECV